MPMYIGSKSEDFVESQARMPYRGSTILANIYTEANGLSAFWRRPDLLFDACQLFPWPNSVGVTQEVDVFPQVLVVTSSSG